MHTTRRGFLAGSAALTALAGLGAPRLAFANGQARKLILVHARGGWDVTCGFDPKPGLDTIDDPALDEDPNNPEDREALETIAGIPLMVNRFKRPAVASFFERWGNRSAVLNGIWTGGISHPACTVRMFTGARTEAFPDIAAITGSSVGADTPIPYMDLSGSGFAGSLASYTGRTGANNQLELLLDRNRALNGPRGSGTTYPGFHPEGEDQAAIQAFLAARNARWATGSYPSARSDQRVEDLLQSRERAESLLDAGSGFADQLELGRQSNLSLMSPTIAELLSGGLCQTVTVEIGVDFDTHDDNSDQHVAWNNAFSSLDVLMNELSGAGLLEDTTIAVISEMTRTPKRNATGGKDHWPVTGIMMLGAGVAGGRVLGGTTELLDGQPVDLETGVLTPGGTVPRYDNVAAGILELVGVDPAEWLPNSEVYRGFHA